ncbi:MAG: AraC family ligand binding domain-containing protein, partial [Actinomycetota bacterium]
MWRADELGGLEVLWASYGHLVFTPHAHEEYLIAVTEGGVGGPIYRGETHEVGPGDVLVLNPEEPHAGGPLTGSPWQYRALYPSAELILQVESEFTGGPQQAPAFAEGVVRDREAARRLRRFHAVAADERSTSLQREALLVEALVWLVGRHSTRRPSLRSSRSEHRGAQRAREYLEEHAVENVSLAELARVAVLSP